MKKIFLIYIVFINLTISACSGETKNQNENKPAVKASKADRSENQEDELEKQIEQIASESKGKVGVKAVVLETGKTVSFNSAEHFPMQSVYKFPIAMVILRQVDEGKIKLDQKVRVEKSDFVGQNMHSPLRDKNPNGAEVSVAELLGFAVSESDGSASDVLVKLAGGFSNIQAYLKDIKVSEINILNTEKELGLDWETQYRNWATPDGAIGLLRVVYEKRGLSEQSNQLLLQLMTETPTGLKRLKGLLPAGTIVAHKTGTSGNKDGVTAATNDIGIVTLPNGKHLAIAVFVSDSPADETAREAVIAKISKAVWDKWGN